jgi:hypothetical protein
MNLLAVSLGATFIGYVAICSAVVFKQTIRSEGEYRLYRTCVAEYIKGKWKIAYLNYL